ncbi:hypothetical protein U14_00085 [Candidatus Moduliflexus flocculans]|uniref:Uncharacterized protein n=1 Tax=Candidatus Moduliflexus flocculans TaxID=1499966 RepID=A0A0S6VPC3_9BACT|nr:hypothetical protein U14_00085 [Candidatus Moduliflexus flocculans]
MKRLKDILTIGDIILIGALCVFSFASIPLFRVLTPPGTTVRIETDGKLFATAALSKNQTFAVPGPLGTTIVEIHDGHVHVAESPCSNKLCVKTGRIHLTGQLIACLPNKVVVRIVGNDDAPYDALTQ